MKSTAESREVIGKNEHNPIKSQSVNHVPTLNISIARTIPIDNVRTTEGGRPYIFAIAFEKFIFFQIFSIFFVFPIDKHKKIW